MRLIVLYFPDVNLKNCTKSTRRDTSLARTEERSVQPKKFRGTWKFNDDGYKKTSKSQRHLCNSTDPDLLCGVIFVDKGFTAKVLFQLLHVRTFI